MICSFAISTHLVGQCVSTSSLMSGTKVFCPTMFGTMVIRRSGAGAAEEVIKTAKVAKMLGLDTVTGFTGSPVWHLLYAFLPNSKGMIEKGFEDFAKRWIPILDEFREVRGQICFEVILPK